MNELIHTSISLGNSWCVTSMSVLLFMRMHSSDTFFLVLVHFTLQSPPSMQYQVWSPHNLLPHLQSTQRVQNEKQILNFRGVKTDTKFACLHLSMHLYQNAICMYFSTVPLSLPKSIHCLDFRVKTNGGLKTNATRIFKLFFFSRCAHIFIHISPYYFMWKLTSIFPWLHSILGN